MIRFNFDFITDWTVTSVHSVYRLLVQNTYFILSNSLFLLLLLFIRLNMNNILFFVVPIFFLLVSFSVQFRAFEEGVEPVSFKRYVEFYRANLKMNWKLFLFYTAVVYFLLLDTRILFVANVPMMVYPLLITGGFLLSSMFFVLLISTDVRSKKISFKKKMMWSLLVSYRLPAVTLLNVLWIIVAFFLLQNFSLAYLCFFGGAINYFIWLNLTRSFSVELFYEQMAENKA